ncbi:ABC transporter ATP-binding protein [Schlegelella sp. S2-27]|uniref:ABC transporter ATP-binding protein n=1 Tax=Caldimonas mangrovi TaxID=2944811 RepID=A0ABT0YIS5_9BURK|nr:ABC transporter ATP-binding protein [Caldimonas mangrovi]MCM5678626.1 ABC transporter ATP-binding protein [Caldimonas mangrovi]
MSPLLRVSGLSKRFGGLVAVNDLHFDVMPGEVVGLLGPNGSGKTTAMNLISGALRADAGQVLFDGVDLARERPHRIARLGVARTFQLVRVLASMNCRENVEAGLAFRPHGLHGRAAHSEAERLLARVGLAGRETLAAAELTYIDQKRLELARALALQPRLLLLDEWLAGLNPTELRTGIALVRSLRDEGLTVVLVEHVMDAVHSLCDRCVVMSAGVRIAAGPTREVLADPHVVKAYLGEEDDAAHGVQHA